MFVKPRYYMADFETTVTGDREQSETEVWAAALVQIKTPDDDYIDEEVYLDNSIDNFMARLNFSTTEFKGNIICYFHNLKFDGSFIVDWLLKHDYSLAVNDWDGKWRADKYISKKSFKCTISDMGQWYTITVKFRSGGRVEFRDSLKLLPFSVAGIGKGFQTTHQKLTMEYVGNMHAGGEITPEQAEYITNDVLVVKEALEIFFADGLNKLTIGSCCKDQYRKSLMQNDYTNFFPILTKKEIDPKVYGEANADAYVRHSYKGGWCYLKPECANIVYKYGCTADVNSLYPSMMLDHDYPIGDPTFWSGNYIPDEAKAEGKIFFVRVKTRFYLKKDKLPTLQIKGSPFYKGNEWLTTSDMFFKGKYHRALLNPDGSRLEMRPTLTLTQMDFELLKSHYDLEDFEILDGCYFWTMSGKLLFGQYINHWAEIKKTTKGARRLEAKLFLNNLYGKFAAKIDSTTKCPYLEDGRVKFTLIHDTDERKEWYIPIGACVTSYARNFTIAAAQANYDSFVYADTDSIHCLCKPSQLKGIAIHPTEFSHWALEATWDEAVFVRQKTYIEHVIEEDQEPCKPYYNIKCAGMDKRPRQLLNASLTGQWIEPEDEDEKRFLSVRRSLKDFRVGLSVPSKLITKRISGGIVLVKTDYCMS